MLIPEGRKKILKLFFGEPYTEVHLRAIARKSGVSPDNVDKSMRLFVQEQVFLRRETPKMVFFKPNIQNPLLLKIFELLELEKREEFFNKNKRIARLIRKYTQDIINLSNKNIQMVILFGSVARGEWSRGSDIDIMVVVSEKKKELTGILDRAKLDVSPLLEIRPVTTTIPQFIEGLKEETEFHKELWRDRIVLYNEFLFWQLVKEVGE